MNSEEVGWGKSLRVKVVINLLKPLARGRMLNLQSKKVWISFQYERLPRFCFQCGVIKHGPEGCLRKTDKLIHGDVNKG